MVSIAFKKTIEAKDFNIERQKLWVIAAASET